MGHLPGTVETGTGGFQFETNVLFRWPSLVCTSISTGSTAPAHPEEATRHLRCVNQLDPDDLRSGPKQIRYSRSKSSPNSN